MAVFHATALARGYRAAETRTRTISDDTTERVREAATALLFEAHREHRETVIVDWAGCSLHLRLDHSPTASTQLTVYGAGADMATVHRAFEQLQELMPTAAPDGDEDKVDVRFWMGGAYEHAVRIERRLTAPRWEEVSANYPASTRRELAAAMSDVEALARRGRVLLWHGPPGTGKTYAVRALAREHSRVATIDCVVEPELFFSKGARYLTELLEADEDEDDEDRWHVLVVEDADELISADAKLRSGQGLSRLLNLADGLFGQAIKVLVVVTTNEPMTSFHPALVRPGRCGSLVSFQRFAADEAQQWLRRAGSRESVSGPATLAELFAMTAGVAPLRSGREVGFHVMTPGERQREDASGAAPSDHAATARRPGRPRAVRGITDEEAERLADWAERLGPEDVISVRPGPAARRRRPR